MLTGLIKDGAIAKDDFGWDCTGKKIWLSMRTYSAYATEMIQIKDKSISQSSTILSINLFPAMFTKYMDAQEVAAATHLMSNESRSW